VVQRGHRHFSKQLLLQTQPREYLPPNMEVQLLVLEGHRHFSKQLLLQTQPREYLPPNMEVQLLVLEGRNMPVTRHEPRLRCRRIRGGWTRQCKTRRVSQFIISRQPAVTDQQCPTPGKDLR